MSLTMAQMLAERARLDRIVTTADQRIEEIKKEAKAARSLLKDWNEMIGKYGAVTNDGALPEPQLLHPCKAPKCGKSFASERALHMHNHRMHSGRNWSNPTKGTRKPTRKAPARKRPATRKKTTTRRKTR